MNYLANELIKKRREELGLTQVELGEKLGVSEKTISKWEIKRGMPDIGILKNLSKELQISIDDLLEERIINNKNKSYNMLKSKF